MTWKEFNEDSIQDLQDGKQYLVKSHKDQKFVELLTWNSHYKCWDDAEGDDYYCDCDQIALYCDIPEC